MAEAEPTEDEMAQMAELARRMQEELRGMTSTEVLSQAGVTLVNVAAARMGMVDGVPDVEPDEARAAIDALGALMPVLEQHAPGPLIDDLRAGLAQLRMAFVELSGGPRSSPGGAGDPPAAAEDPRPATAPEVPRAKIWTPGGDV
jgi:hypothetical protein